MPHPLTRLAIVNRGVAAARLVQAAREYADERGRPLTTVMVHVAEEAHGLPVRMADEAVSVGAGLTSDPMTGRPLAAFHDLGRLERALRTARPDGVWVGWGVLARQPEVADLVTSLGARFVGAPAGALRRLADPAVVARAAAEHGLGEPGRLTGPGLRQVDVLVVVDEGGTAWVVGRHDGTVQRRGEKVLTETPADWLDEALAARLDAIAVRLFTDVGWQGAGTASFLVRIDGAPGDGSADDGSVALAHVSAGFPLGHAVTELCSPLDLAKLQLAVAEGERLEGDPPPRRGHAMAVRLLAEDAEHGFVATPGRIELLRAPAGAGLRVDTGLAEGDVVRADLDPTLAEIAAWGATREEARVRLRAALRHMPVVVDGGTTNKGFLLDLLDRPEIVGPPSGAESVDTGWLDRIAAAGGVPGESHAAEAVVVGAIDAADAADEVDLARFRASARRGRPHVPDTVGHTVELLHVGAPHVLHVARTGEHDYRITPVGGPALDARLERLSRFESQLTVGGRRHRVVSAVQGGDHMVEVDGTAHRLSRDDGGVVATVMPGVVVAMLVSVGDEVAAGDPLAVVESMKMETTVRAPYAGRVRSLLTAPNVQVDAGAPLLRLDPPDRDAPAGRPVPLSGLAVEPAGDVELTLAAAAATLRRFVLGYDVTAADARAADVALAAAASATDADRSAVLAAELDLLAAYADLRGLFRAQRDPDEDALAVSSPQEQLFAFLRSPETDDLPPRFVAQLRRALAHYGVSYPGTDTDDVERAAFRAMRSQQREAEQVPVVTRVLERWLARGPGWTGDPGEAATLRAALQRLVRATARSQPVVADLAREVRFGLVDAPVLEAARERALVEVEARLLALADEPDGPERAEHIVHLVGCSYPIAPLLLGHLRSTAPAERGVPLEVMTRRYHRDQPLADLQVDPLAAPDGTAVLSARVQDDGPVRVVTCALPLAEVPAAATGLEAVARRRALPAEGLQLDLYTWTDDPEPDLDALSAELADALRPLARPGLRHVVVAVATPTGRTREHRLSSVRHLTFRLADEPGEGLVEDRTLRGLHPMMARRLNLWRLSAFELERLPAPEDVYLFRGVARENPKDERLFALAEVRDLTPVLDSTGRVAELPQLETAVLEAFEGIRRYQAPRPPGKRLHWNRVLLYVWPVVDLDDATLERVARSLAPAAEGLGLEEVDVHVRRRVANGNGGSVVRRVMHLSSPTGTGFVISETDPPTGPLEPLDEYTRAVVASRRRGTVYPYELVTQLVAPHAGGRPEVLGGEFVEHDLDESGRLVPVDRAPGGNIAGIVAGVVSTKTDRYPEGMRRVVLLGDPTRALGSLTEAECRRIMAALDLAEAQRIPLEWFALSAGARIAMDSGTENMDWIADVLRRIIEFTQGGHELNVVVTGINVGAQPYWNAEATMLMHTKGILVMTPDSAMVLTGKQALDYSGSVSAEDNHGIGGYERVMGPNGQGQYWAPDLPGAIGVLLAHYDHAYVAPGERFPRRAQTSDPVDRDVRPSPHSLPGSPLTTVGEVLSDETNPGRKLPFDIRSVMRAVMDDDRPPLERWRDMEDADTVVVWDAHLGGIPVCAIGIEGHAIPRHGVVPADGPGQWTSGTFFPMSSKKTARAVNAASGNRPVVVLANLSGFDGSPESMRKVQLEFGAEIGRAVVNFRGPIVFCVVSRYHGGAFVVFSQKLNPMLETIAVEGSSASVIGGAPAAAVVFAGEVAKRTRADDRVVALEAAAGEAAGPERARLRSELADLTSAVRSEKLGEVATQFDQIHSVQRALQVGSVAAIVPAASLRPALVEAVERGMAKELERVGLSG